MAKLYDFSDSGNGYKIRLLCKLLQVPLEVVEVNILRAETTTPEFLRKNPNGKIPVLEVAPDKYLPESNAILCYLAEGTHYLPEAPFERALILSWLFFEQYSHEPYIATPRFILRHTPPDSPRRAELSWRIPRGYAALRVMEHKLAEMPFLDSPRATIADLCLFAYTHRAAEAGMSLQEFPAISHWIARIQNLPGFVAM